MDKYQLQKNLFACIRKKLAPEKNLAQEVAEVLFVGVDAAYKKIRCVRPINILEMQTLMDYFEVDLSDLGPVKNPEFSQSIEELHKVYEDLRKIIKK